MHDNINTELAALKKIARRLEDYDSTELTDDELEALGLITDDPINNIQPEIAGTHEYDPVRFELHEIEGYYLALKTTSQLRGTVIRAVGVGNLQFSGYGLCEEAFREEYEKWHDVRGAGEVGDYSDELYDVADETQRVIAELNSEHALDDRSGVGATTDGDRLYMSTRVGRFDGWESVDFGDDLTETEWMAIQEAVLKSHNPPGGNVETSIVEFVADIEYDTSDLLHDVLEGGETR